MANIGSDQHLRKAPATGEAMSSQPDQPADGRSVAEEPGTTRLRDSMVSVVVGAITALGVGFGIGYEIGKLQSQPNAPNFQESGAQDVQRSPEPVQPHLKASEIVELLRSTEPTPIDAAIERIPWPWFRHVVWRSLDLSWDATTAEEIVVPRVLETQRFQGAFDPFQFHLTANDSTVEISAIAYLISYIKSRPVFEELSTRTYAHTAQKNAYVSVNVPASLSDQSSIMIFVQIKGFRNNLNDQNDASLFHLGVIGDAR